MFSVRAAQKLLKALAGGEPIARHRARFELADSMVRRLGFRMYRHSLAWHDDAEFREAWARYPETDGFVHDRKFVCFSLARSVATLPGDTAECGVYRGASSFLIASATTSNDVPEPVRAARRHLGFDSFEGLSAPEAIDVPAESTTLRWKTGDLSMPLEVARRNLATLAHVSLLPGWIPTRFAEVAHRRFCFVHLDVDLYQPTLDSLQFFYERVVPGGILLCDDYGSSACPGAKRACDEFAASRPERRWVHLTSGQGLLVKR